MVNQELPYADVGQAVAVSAGDAVERIRNRLGQPSLWVSRYIAQRTYAETSWIFQQYPLIIGSITLRKSIHLFAESAAGGEGHGTFTAPFAGQILRAIVRALEPDFDRDAPEDAEVAGVLTDAGLPTGEGLLAAVGDRLDAALRASPKVSGIVDVTLGAAQGENGPLHLNLRFGEGCDDVAALPWELLRRDGRFVVADNTVAVTRTPLGAAPYAEALGSLPLRVLLVLSEPLGQPPVAPQRQARALAHGLCALAAEGAVVVDELRPPTYDTLVEAVRTGGYHVLHFYGHGVYRDGAGHLLFENEYGGPDLVRADDVGAVLHNSGVRLVVMGACQSAMGGADRWSSAAAALLRAGVPLVIGMQVSMRVDAAQAFARQFYVSLAAGKDVTQALGDVRLDNLKSFVPCPSYRFLQQQRTHLASVLVQGDQWVSTQIPRVDFHLGRVLHDKHHPADESLSRVCQHGQAGQLGELLTKPMHNLFDRLLSACLPIGFFGRVGQTGNLVQVKLMPLANTDLHGCTP